MKRVSVHTRQSEESSSFCKKEPKTLDPQSWQVVLGSCAKPMDVFCFFFSKKKLLAEAHVLGPQHGLDGGGG
jgi:hypothetical protein